MAVASDQDTHVQIIGYALAVRSGKTPDFYSANPLFRLCYGSGATMLAPRVQRRGDRSSAIASGKGARVS